ncbi:MAG: hypothetical protein QM820_34385 [Minicystis sp.]
MSNPASTNYGLKESGTARAAAAIALVILMGSAGCAYQAILSALDHVRLLWAGGAVATLVVAAVFASAAADAQMENRNQREDAARRMLDQELSEEGTKRAEKLLSLQEQQLRRYYNLNLRQGFWAFVAGISCICAGFAIVAVTFYVVKQMAGSNSQAAAQVVVGAVGVIGTILANYVAAVYLKMYGSVGENLTAFHSKLSATHDIFLSNLMVSRIKDDDRRDEALRALALAIVLGKSADPPNAKSPTDKPPTANAGDKGKDAVPPEKQAEASSLRTVPPAQQAGGA